MTDIPVVTLGSSEAPLDLKRAAEGAGFFYLRGHKIPRRAIADAIEASKTFFAQPPSVKAAVDVDARHRGYIGPGEAVLDTDAPADTKESFIWGYDREPRPECSLVGPNQWPDGLRDALTVYFNAAIQAGMILLRDLARSLALDEDFFLHHYRDPLARGSIIHYPPSTDGGLGTTPHTDYGCLTLLWQDDVGGLQVESSPGQWMDVPPAPDCLVVNIGDLMKRWTGGRLPSTRHRVLTHPSRHRYSLAVFFDPGHATRIDGVTCGDYILSRFDDVFAYRTKP